jgi:AcrR family transcriptional regulator
VAEHSGRRERKKLTTHQLLRSAALRLGAERCLADVTVEEIAEEADVSVRTFYDHFRSKEDAMIGFDAYRVDQLRVALAERPLGESPLDALHTVLRMMLEESSFEWPLRMKVIATNPALLPRMFTSFIIYERAMIEAVAARTGLDADHDLYPAVVTAVAAGALRASLTVWRANGERDDLTEIFDTAFAHVAHGLVEPDPVRERKV